MSRPTIWMGGGFVVVSILIQATWLGLPAILLSIALLLAFLLWTVGRWRARLPWPRNRRDLQENDLKSNPTPVAESQRIESLDVLRGFAVLGILTMNIGAFSMPSATYFDPTAYGDLSGLNGWVWRLTHLLRRSEVHGDLFHALRRGNRSHGRAL